MDQQHMLLYGLAGLAFLAVAGIGFAFTGSGENASAARRARQYQTRHKTAASKRAREDTSNRRRQTQQMLSTLRKDNKRRALMPRDLSTRLQQAGLDVPVPMFWAFCIVLGVSMGVLVYMSGADGMTIRGVELRSRPAIIGAAVFAGIIGMPRWLLGMLAKMRAKKLLNQFADAIDIIVRGVKSGLPLNECLRIIARESPAPLGPEVRQLTDNLQMGNTLDQALRKFHLRVPLSEVNFFAIVLTIQSKSGGNLSEALGNLSAVIRSRKMMREKIKALSSEAKASALIIGCLPFAVSGMLFVTSPDYINLLFTTPTGHVILAMGAGLMFVGVTVMRKMISFDI